MVSLPQLHLCEVSAGGEEGFQILPAGLEEEDWTREGREDPDLCDMGGAREGREGSEGAQTEELSHYNRADICGCALLSGKTSLLPMRVGESGWD